MHTGKDSRDSHGSRRRGGALQTGEGLAKCGWGPALETGQTLHKGQTADTGGVLDRRGACAGTVSSAGEVLPRQNRLSKEAKAP